jgi:predicted nucleic acid-binding protein
MLRRSNTVTEGDDKDVMRSDPAKEHSSRLKLKSEAVVHGHWTFSGETMWSCYDPLEWIDNTVHHAAMGIMLAALRKKLSLVDCVSFETMRLLGVTTAFTLDRHFKEQGFICLPA